MKSDYRFKKEYPVIDTAKFIASLLVIAIHVPLFGPGENFEVVNFYFRQILTRIAVPFFFVCSGFFFFRKIINVNNDKLIKKTVFLYIKKLIRMYLIWTLVYLFFIIKSILHGRNTPILALRDFLFIGSYLHLWYLPALIVAVLLVSFLIIKNVKVKNIIIISFLLYIIGLLGQSYNVIFRYLEKIPYVGIGVSGIGYYFREIFYTTRGGLFEGFLFVSFGYLFAKKEIDISRKKASILLAVSIVLYIAEVIVVKYFGWGLEEDMYLMLVPLIFFLFYLLISKETETNNHESLSEKENLNGLLIKEKKILGLKVDNVLLRNISTLVFYIHLFVFALYKDIVKITGGIFSENESIYVQVTIISIIASFLIIRLSETKYFKWLKKIYS